MPASRCRDSRCTLPSCAKVAVERGEVESQNVAGILPGSDPVLKDQYVVLSAHLDHLGIGEPINGDRIYNGAMDNASGVATLLDIARIAERIQAEAAPLAALRGGHG